MKPYIIAIIAVAAVLVLLFVFAYICYRTAFGRRYDKIPLLKYFTAADFNLEAEPVSCLSGKIMLRGFIYRKADIQSKDKLVIFCHGMGAGHIAYMTEIAYFCNLGYPVLAIDNTGCNMSEGKNIRGMYSGVKCVVSAIDFAKADTRLKDYGIYLVGHSWGAYSALCASFERKVGAVVAVSAPDNPVRTVYSVASAVLTKPVAALLYPFWLLINFFAFGVKGNVSAAECARKSQTPSLIIHGDKDGVVKEDNAVFYKTDGENVTKRLAEGKAHNPYNTEAAEKLLAELSDNLSKAKKTTDESYFDNFDFSAATEEDGLIMDLIAGFIEKN